MWAEKDLAGLERELQAIKHSIRIQAFTAEECKSDLSELRISIAEGQNKVRTLKAELKTALADNDLAAVTEAITRDFANFALKPLIEQKAILRRYVERIDVIFNPATASFIPWFTVKAGLPAAFRPTGLVDSLGTLATGLPGGDGEAVRLQDGVTKFETTSRTGSLLLPSARFP